jgi:hypothetical protein
MIAQGGFRRSFADHSRISRSQDCHDPGKTNVPDAVHKLEEGSQTAIMKAAHRVTKV